MLEKLRLRKVSNSTEIAQMAEMQENEIKPHMFGRERLSTTARYELQNPREKSTGTRGSVQKTDII